MVKNNSNYVDGYVVKIKKSNFDKYKKMAEQAAQVWIENGALEYCECLGDDLTPDTEGVVMGQFSNLLDCSDDELVIFSFIVYESRTKRDEVNKVVMEKMKELGDCNDNMPFDTKNMFWGDLNLLFV